MLKEAIYHRPDNNFSYIYQDNKVHIRLRTKKKDVKKVSLIHGDPYIFTKKGWTYEKKKMVKSGSTDLFDYWFVELTPPHHRLRYAFELTDNEENIIYTEKGFFAEIPNDDIGNFFCFPYVHNSDMFHAPSWVKDTVWYQIFPERFANGDTNNDPKNTLAWGSEEPTPDNFFGGDFQGVIDHMDYLVDLGISGIYFTPIFKAFSNHKYDTIDYMEIDSQFGDKETFKKLVDLAHEKGIRIMLDAVFNHCGYFFPQWQDVVEKGKKSEFVDWFHCLDFPIVTEPKPNYLAFGFYPAMPKLNTQNPAVKEYLLEVGRYWVREFGIDGWRLDVANEVDHGFWREFRKEVKGINPDVYILGEIWHDSMPWLLGEQFDAVMNYPFTTAVVNYFAKGIISTKMFQNDINHVLHMYPNNVNEVAFNLLDSHDTPRILTVAKDKKERVKLLYVFFLSFTGTPSIYYGDEIGMNGDQDPDCRKCMIWEREKQDLDMFAHTKKLLSLRKEHEAFGNKGTFEFVSAKSDVLTYKKTCGQEVLYFALNNGAKAKKVTLSKKEKGTVIYTNQEIIFEQKNNTFELEPFGFAILKM